MFNFKSLHDAVSYFKNEDVARDFFEKMRWPDGRIICPLCGVRDAYRMSDYRQYKCRDKDCKAQFTVTVGTVLENTKLPLAKLAIAMYLLSAHKKGISSHQLARDLNIRQKAAWFLAHRIREMFKQNGIAELTGTVEADETMVGGKFANMPKKRRAKLVANEQSNKTPVMGLLERSGDAKLVVIGPDSLKDVVRQQVSTNAFINTDENNAYVGLNQEFADHDTVNHSQGEFVKGDITTNSVEGMFSLFKRCIFGTWHQISAKHLQAYCNEMTYRFNSRKIKDGERFVRTFNNIQGRLTWKQLTEKT
jgi:transposase-like protein